jgi:hypothetical protein
VSTHKLGQPAELRDWLQANLPCQDGKYKSAVHVTPRTRDYRRCAAWAADVYEVQAFYVRMGLESLTALEEALVKMPEATLVTRVVPSERMHGNAFTNSDWPAVLGYFRRDRNDLRPQVMALLEDPR